MSETTRAAGITRRIRRFAVGYVAVAAWVLAAVALPSRPVEEVALAIEPDTPAGTLDEVVAPDAAGRTLATGPATEAASPSAGGAEPGRTTSPGSAETAAGTDAGAQTATADGDLLGLTKAGVECRPGVQQMPLNSYSAPCAPAWSGDNGGTTHRGVTADTIRIVRRGFPESANSQAVDAVVQQAGGADPEVADAVRDTFIEHFEATYELYGRRVEWIDYESEYGNATEEVQGKGREGACLDAEVIAEELRAFGVASGSRPFTECAAQRGLMVFNGAAYSSETFYRSVHPYAWHITMECERINYQVYEYFGKRLAFKPARYAGSEALRSKERVFGTYIPVSNSGDTACADIGNELAAHYGLSSSSTYRYTLDVSRFPDEAARGIIQFKRDGVTSIVLACDPISVIFLTQSATGQDYWPEWLVIGVALTDIDNAARLYDQEQVDGHMFGQSQLGATPDILGPTSEPGILYESITGQEIPAGTAGDFHPLSHIYNFLQVAGPRPSPEAVAAGVATLPRLGGPRYSAGEWFFGENPDGTPGFDHTAVEDSREVYWVGNVRSPADGEAGTFIATYGGKRFGNGDWPAEDPPVYPGQ